MKCSYCVSGCVDETPLSTKARPEGELAAKIENKNTEQNVGDALEYEGMANEAGQLPPELDDVVNTDWSNFNLDPELWQYV